MAQPWIDADEPGLRVRALSGKTLVGAVIVPIKMRVEVDRPDQCRHLVTLDVDMIDGEATVTQLTVVSERPQLPPSPVTVDDLAGLPAPGEAFMVDDSDDGPPVSPSVTGTDLRRIPVERWLVEAIRTIGQPAEPTTSGRLRAGGAGTADPKVIAELVRRRGELGAWKLDADHLTQVARLYEDAERLHLRPVKYVQEKFGERSGQPIPRGTASRWIDMARERGYLPRKGRKR